MDESRLGAERCRSLLEATGAASGSLGNLPSLRQAMLRYQGHLDQAVTEGKLSPDGRTAPESLVSGLLRAAGDTSGP